MTKKFTHEEIRLAREILGLPEKATMDFIKERYRILCRQNHPDVHLDDSEDYVHKMREINKAYELILEYCNNYQFSFKPDDMEDNPEDWWQKQFGNDPMWGNGDNKNENK